MLLQELKWWNLSNADTFECIFSGGNFVHNLFPLGPWKCLDTRGGPLYSDSTVYPC
jgi:hypothetical protein